MIDSEYVIYEGRKFTLEWFFSENFRSQALAFYRSLPLRERTGIMKLFKRLADGGVIKDKTKFRYEGDRLFAFKTHASRFMCFFYQHQKIIITNAFIKKQQKLPKFEKTKAEKAMVDYISRVTQEAYYVDKKERVNI